MLGTTLGATNKTSQFQVIRSEFGQNNSFMLQKAFENWIKKNCIVITFGMESHLLNISLKSEICWSQ
jgi:hypothetical protein